MAKICVAFYNAVYCENDESVMPCWYEAFLGGLKDLGNKVLIFPIKDFGINHEVIDEKTKKMILDFSPDLYISFNNVFYDMSFLDCPKIVYEADTPIYYSNKHRLNKDNDSLFFVWGDTEAKYLNEVFGIDSKQIFKVRPFTSIRSDESIVQSSNISFIGTRFGVSRNNEMGSLAGENATIREQYFRCLKEVVENPYISKVELVKNIEITDDKLIEMIDIPGMVMMMSSEMRVRVLSSIVDLGLDLYGTETWLSKYHFDSRINAAYKNKKVYSLQHNESIYNKSVIGINISHYQAKDCFSWRVLDIMASNACLVTDSWSGVKSFFPYLDIPIYEDEHEARKKCMQLLADRDTTRDIVAECHKTINKNYRFINHAKEIEDIVGVNLNLNTNINAK